RCGTALRLPTGPPAAGPALPVVGRRNDVGPRVGGVRRDHHVCRQPARPDADPAPRRVHRPRIRPPGRGCALRDPAGVLLHPAPRPPVLLDRRLAGTVACSRSARVGNGAPPPGAAPASPSSWSSTWTRGACWWW